MRMIIKGLMAFCLLVWMITGCKKNDDRGIAVNVDASVKMSSFTIGGITGVINDSTDTVQISLPFGYNRTAVQPKIDIPAGATVSPASGATVNLAGSVVFRVINGNIYRDYTVIPSEQKAILSFVVAGVTATIDETARTIKALVSVGTDLTTLAPVITLATGATISPASGAATDFTAPVIYTVKQDTASVNYTVTVSVPSTVGFLGIAATSDAIANADEKAAWTWLKSVNSQATYISFNDIQNGSAYLEKYKVIWWHEDATQDLPSIASDPTVIAALKQFYAVGGSFFLSSFGMRYVDVLGIVPAGKGPDQYFGAGGLFVDTNPWGISYEGYETHPAFAGLPLATQNPYPTTWLISGGAYRYNHFTQWTMGAFGGSAATWRTMTGGLDLASADNDEYHNSAVVMAEFPATSGHGAAITIGSGSYDWYSEPNPSNINEVPVNTDLPNIEKLTQNVLDYLVK